MTESLYMQRKDRSDAKEDSRRKNLFAGRHNFVPIP